VSASSAVLIFRSRASWLSESGIIKAKAMVLIKEKTTATMKTTVVEFVVRRINAEISGPTAIPIDIAPVKREKIRALSQS
jgi:hypothetical protein